MIDLKSILLKRLYILINVHTFHATPVWMRRTGSAASPPPAEWAARTAAAARDRRRCAARPRRAGTPPGSAPEEWNGEVA